MSVLGVVVDYSVIVLPPVYPGGGETELFSYVCQGSPLLECFECCVWGTIGGVGPLVGGCFPPLQ